jgi:hypothetical protein
MPKQAGSALSDLPGALRVIAGVYAVFALANMFFIWSALAWWPSARTPGQRALFVLALLVWIPQFISYAILDVLEAFRPYTAVESHLTLTLLSTAIYAPLVLWYRQRRGAVEQQDAADGAGKMERRS